MDREISEPARGSRSGARKMVKSTSVVASMTMLSRVLGFLRDVLFATVFGAGPAFDAFVVAFKLPNFLRRLFAEGAFSQAFVPVLSEYRTKRSHQEAQQFVSHIAGTLGLVLLIVVLLAELLAPVIIMVFAPGFATSGQRYIYATHMLHITFPYLLLIGLTAFSGATLNAYNRFALPAFTPVLLNLALILVAWFWAPHTATPIYTLAWGVLLGGVAQLLIQFPFLKKIKLIPRFKPSWKDSGVRRVLKLMIPALFGVSVAQISLFADNFFASFLQEGSISWLYYSDRLVYLPQGVIGVALATVVLPHLSRHHANKNRDAYSNTIDWAIRSALLVGLPSALGLLILAVPILATLIHHGAFNDFDVMMTAKSLRAFSIGLPAFMLIKIFASAFYSRQNIKTPVKVAAVAMLANFIFIAAFIYPLRHTGLALSTSLASILNAVWLFVLLYRRNIFVARAGWIALAARVVLANVVMGLVIYWLIGGISRWFEWGTWTRAWHLVVIIALGIVSYLLSLLLFGLRKQHLRPLV